MVYLPGRRRRRLSAKGFGRVLFWIPIAAVIGLEALGVDVPMFEVAGFLLAISAAGAGWQLIVKARARHFDREAKLANHHLATGKPARAEAELTRLEAQFRWPRFLGRIAVFQRAIAVELQGRFAEAIEHLAALDATGGIPTFDGRIAINLAYCHALAGDLEAASAWLGEANRRTGGKVEIIPELVIALREGRAAQVRDRLEAEWTALERANTGSTLRRIRLLRAFAIAQTVGPRDAGAVEVVLAGLRPASHDEFAYMAKHWPELDQFVRAQLA